MRRSAAWGRMVCAALLSLFLAIGLSGVALAKSYSITRVEITAAINPDGSMDVIERRTFRFSGSFTWVTQDLLLTGSQGITDIKVSENGHEYSLAPSGPGTYSIKETPGMIQVTWRFEATDESRTFELSYRVKGAVVAHRDVAELYWKFIGAGWEVSSSNIKVELKLPSGARNDEIRAWGHGPLPGTVKIVSPELVTWTLPKLPSGQFLEGRVVFPKRLVPQATNIDDRDALSSILSEEAAWAARANRSRTLSLAVTVGSSLILLASITAAFLLKMLYGRDFEPAFVGEYYRELPADYSPAEAGCLWRFGNVGANEVTATILDLARRGFLAIEVATPDAGLPEGLAGTKTRPESGPSYVFKRLKTGEESLLKPHEKMVLDLLFRSASRGDDSLSFDDLRKWARDDPRSINEFLTGFREAVRTTEASRSFFDQGIQKVKQREIGAGVALVLIGTVAATISQNPLGVLASLGGLILIAAGALMRRRSPEGSTEMAKWRAFRRFLLHFSSLDRATLPSLAVWEHYLVYAVVLGVAREVLSQLKIVYPEITQPRVPGFHPWMWMRLAGISPSTVSIGDLVTGLTDALHTSIQTAVNYAPSSGAGFGGGFSRGGGGGGGGGGGRAG